MSARPRKPAPVGDLVARFLAKRTHHPGREHEADVLRVFTAFNGIGPPISEHAEPASFRGGILGLTVGDSTWLTELTFLKKDIIDRLNDALGRKRVRDLRFRLGTLTRKKAPKKDPMPRLDPAQRALVEAWIAPIHDEAVREAVARAATRSIAQRHSTAPAKAPVPGPAGPRGSAPAVTPPDPTPRRDRWKEKKRS